jgi:hypothetical protein
MVEASTSGLSAPVISLGRRIRRYVAVLLLVGAALFCLYTWAAWTFAYSEGERAGYVQKFSKRGWLCKTWEGELAMANLPGAMPEVFHFTVTDDAVAALVNQSMGQRVVLHYKQHVGLPTSCFGDTEYFVQTVRRIEQ